MSLDVWKVRVAVSIWHEYQAAGGEVFFRRDNLICQFARRWPEEGPTRVGPTMVLQIRCDEPPTRYQVEGVLLFLIDIAKQWRQHDPLPVRPNVGLRGPQQAAV